MRDNLRYVHTSSKSILVLSKSVGSSKEVLISLSIVLRIFPFLCCGICCNCCTWILSKRLTHMQLSYTLVHFLRKAKLTSVVLLITLPPWSWILYEDKGVGLSTLLSWSTILCVDIRVGLSTSAALYFNSKVVSSVKVNINSKLGCFCLYNIILKQYKFLKYYILRLKYERWELHFDNSPLSKFSWFYH